MTIKRSTKVVVERQLFFNCVKLLAKVIFKLTTMTKPIQNEPFTVGGLTQCEHSDLRAEV